MSDGKGEYRVAINDSAADDGKTSPAPSIVAPSIFTLSPGARAALPIASYCCASILMTVTNKYVVSGYGFNMNFLLLTVQVSHYYIFITCYHFKEGEEIIFVFLHFCNIITLNITC